MSNDLTRDEVRAMAADIGLTRYSDAHLDELVRATRIARARRAALRVETLVPSDEPAHVLRLAHEVVR